MLLSNSEQYWLQRNRMPHQNQPKASAKIAIPKVHHHRHGRLTGRVPGARYVQYHLSAQNQLTLIAACLITLSVLILIYVTDFTITSYFGRFIKETNSKASIPAETIGFEITYEEMFQEIAAQYELDWHLLAQAAYQESGLNPRAVGKDDDTGLMQIIPSTWNEWAPKVGVSDPFDPYSNVHVAAAYLAFLREYFSEMGYPEDRWMLVAYNWGPDNLRRLLEDGRGWEQVPEKRQRYALSILRSVSDTPPGWEEIRDKMVTGRNLTKPALSIK
jgi:soluble lytic murein transglycosylase-like protein